MSGHIYLSNECEIEIRSEVVPFYASHSDLICRGNKIFIDTGEGLQEINAEDIYDF